MKIKQFWPMHLVEKITLMSMVTSDVAQMAYFHEFSSKYFFTCFWFFFWLPFFWGWPWQNGISHMSLDALTQLIASTESTELAEEQNQPTVMIWPLRGGALANESTWSTRINRINRTTESTELAKQQNQPTVKIWPLRGGSCQRINPNQPN